MKKEAYTAPSTIVVCTFADIAIMAGSSISTEVMQEEFDSESMTSLSRRSNNVWGDDED